MTFALPRRTRSLLAVAAVAALCACDRGESHWQMRSAGQWGELLWGSPEEVTTAERALRELRSHDPEGVIAALEKALKTRPPKATATPFSLAVDAETVKRLGLPTLPAPEAVQLDLAIVRERIRASSVGTATIKGTDQVDVVLNKPLDRADLLRLQARLAGRRGTLDVMAIAFDPARPRRGEEAAEGSKVLADEVARFLAAREAVRPYAPTDDTRRAVPRAGRAAAAPADFLLLVEPKTAEDAVDERSIASAAPGRSPEGVPAVVVQWTDPAPRVERFAKERAGKRYAVVLDGVVAATTETPAAGARSWTIPVAEADDPAARELATTLAIAWPLGRLPYPLVPVPPPADYGTDPPPENQVSRVTAGFGKLVDPMLIRLSKEAPEAWTRASAAWAHSEVERGVGSQGE